MNPAVYEGFRANEKFVTFEGFDASGNKEDKEKDKWDSFYRNYYLSDKQKEKEERKNLEKKKKEKEEDGAIDSSLVYLGLGVATLGAAVIIVMSLRK
jgi:hypothetical protein